jgi:hypothetical protein
MATDYIQKEILIVTTFRTREGQRLNLEPKSHGSKDNARESFDEGCLNGLLDEMLPLVIHRTSRNSPLFIWDLYIGQQTVCAEIAQGPLSYDVFHSVNPYVFLAYCHYS